MKANLKGLGGIKGLALRHGEKVAIAIFGLVSVWFIYKSLQLTHLEDRLQADNLKGLVTSTNTAITASNWPEDGTEEAQNIRKHKEIAKSAIPKIDDKDFEFHGIDVPVITATQLRSDPVVRNAVEVRARGESGLLAFRDENTIAEQNRRQQLKDEETRKEEERKAAERQEDGGAEVPGGRNPEGGPGTEVYDPENPGRRLIEGRGTPAGVLLQGGERLERVSWATVVAKVPIREQLELFKDAFRNARGYDPARDFPQYVAYQVQRCEVVAGKPTDWKIVNVYDGQKKKAGNYVNADTVTKLSALAAAEWAGAALEPVDSRWTDLVLTLPLPPLVGRNFGADVTHPDIPLAANAPPPEGLAVPAAETAATPVNEEDDGTITAGSGGQPGPTGGEYPQPIRPMGPNYGGGEMRRPGFSMRGMVPGGPESEPGARMMPGAGQMGAGGGSFPSQHNPLPREVDFLLLRFFDYTVEAGKEYQYRVMLYIADPNGSPLDEGYLESSVIDRRRNEFQQAKAKGAKTDLQRPRAAEKWSDPSPVVGIPLGGLVHVAQAKAPSSKTANDEPTITMFAEAFDIEPTDGSAIHIAQETELPRGAVINLKGKMQYTGENDLWIDTKDSYSLNTGFTVLDVDGGDELGKKMTAPARVLMMDGAGQLIVRDELADKPNVQYLRSVFSDKPRRSNQPPAGQFGPEGGRGPGRRGGP